MISLSQKLEGNIVHNRIRLLREDKGLSRVAFGKKIGVSGDVINNLERGRAKIKDHIVKLICSEYSVNEEWLRTGSGSMYIEPDTFNLDNYAKQHDATKLELELVKIYFGLEQNIRKAFLNHFQKHFTNTSASDDLTIAATTVPEAEAAYIKCHSCSAQNTNSSVMNTTTDSDTQKITNK